MLTRRQRAQVMYANAYAVNLARKTPAFCSALRAADVVFCDGYGVWLAARLLRTPLPERYTPPDWIGQLVEQCAGHGHRLFLLGAEPGVADAAAARLSERFPTLQVAAHHGYFNVDGPDNEIVLRHIRAAAPDVLLVGMGMPRQELWMRCNQDRHDARVVVAVGALFDYLSGRVERGPRWLTDSGGEWLWRLAQEPRRLWSRYLFGNPVFAWYVWRQWWRLRGPPR